MIFQSQLQVLDLRTDREQELLRLVYLDLSPRPGTPYGGSLWLLVPGVEAGLATSQYIETIIVIRAEVVG